MEFSLLHVLLSLPFLLVALNYLLHKTSRSKKLPPSPPSLPIIGHLHLLRQPLHQSLSALAEKYGPVFFIRFGSQPTFIVSTLEAAEDCFTKNDIVLANRPKSTGGKYFGYNYTTISTSPYGDHWRNLRKVSAVEIFSVHRLNILMGIRRDELRRLVRKLSLGSLQGFTRVEMRSNLTELTFNIMMRMVAGKRYFGDDVADDEESKEFRRIVKEVAKTGGASNPREFVPALRWLGFGWLNKRMIELFKKTDAFLQGLIDEHRQKKIDGSEIKNIMIDHLLNLQEQEPDYYTDQIIKGLIVNIISETLRLKPAAPLLLPHLASEDCQIAGYHVPRNSMAMVNAWAIHRDPKLWDDPTVFKPERFEGRPGEENKAQKLIMPFGIGRRACPGVPLAQRVVGLALELLIQCFDWERVSQEEVDLTEDRGLTMMPKAVPLEVMCKARPIINKLYSDEAKISKGEQGQD